MSPAAMPLPASGGAYRALDRNQRTAVASTCRDRAAAAARGAAARELRAVDPRALRRQLDGAYIAVAERRRPVAQVCRDELPFVTPGVRIDIDGATGTPDGSSFTIQTRSDRRLSISGRVTPPPSGAGVIARRDVGRAIRRRATVGRDGRFTLPPVRLRRIADNTFTITIRAAAHAPRKVLLSAICVDCLAGRSSSGGKP